MFIEKVKTKEEGMNANESYPTGKDSSAEQAQNTLGFVKSPVLFHRPWNDFYYKVKSAARMPALIGFYATSQLINQHPLILKLQIKYAT